jgi:hypothetical protein
MEAGRYSIWVSEQLHPAAAIHNSDPAAYALVVQKALIPVSFFRYPRVSIDPVHLPGLSPIV